VKYQLVHNKKDLNSTLPEDTTLHNWLTKQRTRINAFKSGNKKNLKGKRLQTVEEDAEIMELLGVKWKILETPFRSFEDYMLELRAYHKTHGHIKVRRLTPGTNLGEWIDRI